MGALRTREDLRKYQVKGAKYLDRFPRFFLQTKMGGGKTVTVLTAFADLKWEFMTARMLVISTRTIVTTVWPFEPAQWEHLKHLKVSVIHGSPEDRVKAVHTKADIHCVSVDNLVWLAEYIGVSWRWDWVVIDESDFFKNRASNRFTALLGGIIHGTKTKPDRRLPGVLNKIERMTLLSGTPAPNSLMDLWPQYFLLDRGYRLGHNITAYRNRWFYYSEREAKYLPKRNTVDEISKLVSDITYVVEDYSGMPEVNYVYHRVPLSDRVKKDFRRFRREKLLELVGTEITAVSAGVLFGKLCQYSNGAIYDAEKNTHIVHDEKLSALEELIEQAGGQPVLVAYAFHHDKDRILAHIKGAEFLDGSPKTVARWNAGEIPVLVAHPGSCGHGLNLQHGGSVLIWFGLTPRLGYFLQMNSRLARSGQLNAVFVHLLIADGTADDRLVELLEGKNETQETFASLVKQMLEELEQPNAA